MMGKVHWIVVDKEPVVSLVKTVSCSGLAGPA